MDVDLLDVFPHMHYLGKNFEATATRPDGSTVPLIRIPRWDFRWQGSYLYREPVHLPKGTRIDARFAYDNSADNPSNPSTPPIRVTEGWQSTDEMCLFYFKVVPAEPERVNALRRAMYRSFERSPRVGKSD